MKPREGIMSNSRKKKLTSRVDEDASPTFRMVSCIQETTPEESTMKDHMELRVIHDHNQQLASRGARPRDKPGADIKSLTLHMESNARDLSGCVSPDAVPITPEAGGGVLRYNTSSTPAGQQPPSSTEQSGARQHGTASVPTRPKAQPKPEAFQVKSKCGKGGLSDDISAQIQDSVNALLDKSESGNDMCVSSSSKSVPSSSKSVSRSSKCVSSTSKSLSSRSKSVSNSSVPVSSSPAVAVSCTSSEELCISAIKLSDEDDIPDSMVPVEVAMECYDVLLLYSEEEQEYAMKVKEHLETEVHLGTNDGIQVLLYEDLVRIVNRQIGCLKEGMEHCTYVFILITKTFCDSNLSLFLGEECLIKSIHDQNKRWSVVPLFTQPKRSADYNIPTGLNCLKGISYHTKDEFYFSNMRKMIEQRRYIKFEREKKRQKDIKNWKEDKRHELHMERIREEARERMSKAMKEKQLKQLEESLEKETANPSFMLGPASGDFQSIPPNYQCMPQVNYSYQKMNMPQFNNFPPSQYPWPNLGFYQGPYGPPISSTMSYQHLPQALGGYGTLQGYGGISQSHSMPGNMVEMAGYYQRGQYIGHPAASQGGLPTPPPPYAISQQDSNAARSGLTRQQGPTEQIDTSLQNQGFTNMRVGTDQSTDSARCDAGKQQVAKDFEEKPGSRETCHDSTQISEKVKPEESLIKEQSFDAINYLRQSESGRAPQKFTHTDRDHHQGAHINPARGETVGRQTEQVVSTEWSQSLLRDASSNSGREHEEEEEVCHHAGSRSAPTKTPVLDSSVEEDATRHIEETSVKQHLEGLGLRELSTAGTHQSSPITDSGYASSSRSASKISSATYILRSLGVASSTKQGRSGAEQKGAQTFSSMADSLSSSKRAESDSLSGPWRDESAAEQRAEQQRQQQNTGRAEQQLEGMVREVHHHHHEAKRVIIIQNCDRVHLGDITTVQTVQHENAAEYRPGHSGWEDRSDTRLGEAEVEEGDDDDDDEERRADEACDNRAHVSDEHRPQTLDPPAEHDTWVKVSAMDCSERSVTNRDEQTSLKTSSGHEVVKSDVPFTGDYSDLAASAMILSQGGDADRKGAGKIGVGRTEGSADTSREGEDAKIYFHESGDRPAAMKEVGRSAEESTESSKPEFENLAYMSKQTSSSSLTVQDNVKTGQHADMAEAVSLSSGMGAYSNVTTVKGMCGDLIPGQRDEGGRNEELSGYQSSKYEHGENKSAVLSIVQRYLPKKMMKRENSNSHEAGKTGALPGTGSSREVALSGSSLATILSPRSHEAVLSGGSHEAVLSTSSHETVLSAGSHEAVLSAVSHEAVLSAVSHEALSFTGSHEALSSVSSHHEGMLSGCRSSSESMLSRHSQRAVLSDDFTDVSTDLSCEEGTPVDPRQGLPKHRSRSLKKKADKECVIS